MKQRVTFTLPTPEKCLALGIKFEGLKERMLLWLMGVAAGVSYCSGDHFQVVWSDKRTILVEGDSLTVLNSVQDSMEAYGFTTNEVQPQTVNLVCKNTSW